jgi:hypothetical protein
MKRVPSQRKTRTNLPPGALRCRRKFLRIFPGGFADPDYIELERDYKWEAHRRWESSLSPETFRSLLRAERHSQIAALAVAIEARTNLLFSFEKMALRDAVRSDAGARAFARGLYDLLHSPADLEARISNWIEAVATLPRRQTRVLTWPLATVFGFLAQPKIHIFFKPRVTQAAARAYGYELEYTPRPNWATYADLLQFADQVRRDTLDLKPRDQVDIQSFMWVQGSDEYEE